MKKSCPITPYMIGGGRIMGERSKVVHLTTVHHPYDPRIYYKQCMSLHHSDHYDVALIAQAPRDGIDETKPIEHIVLPTYRNRLSRMIFGSIHTYKLAKQQQAAIYVFHDPELLFIGKLLKKKDNVVVYDIHEDYVTSILQKQYLKKPIRTLAAKAYKFLEKICTKKMELSLAEKYYKESYPTGTCILNYPIIKKSKIEQNKQEQPIEKKLLYTGNVTYDRGALQHAAIPTLDPEIEVQLIGKCSSSLAEKMYEASGSEKDRLHIEGIDTFVVKDRIDEMYQQHQWLAGVALFPPTEHYKKKELTKFFEYMSAGIPVLCSDFPLWKAFIEEHQCGITVDPLDEKAVQAAIQTLKANPEKAKDLGRNGKKALEKDLNWKAEEKKLLRWYDELVKEKC